MKHQKQRPFLEPAMKRAAKKIGKQMLIDFERLHDDAVTIRLNKNQRQLFEAYGISVLGIDLERTLQYFLMRGMDDVIRSGILGKATEQRKLVKRILRDAK